MNFSFDFTLSRTFNGDRIRQAREMAALTQSELARRVDVSQAMIAHIENGLKQPSVELAEAIARETGVAMDFLQRPSGPNLGEGTLLFRARSGVSAKQLTQARRMAECVLEMYGGMAAEFDLPPVTLHPVQGTPASAAAAAREMLRLAPGQPIAHLVRSFEKAGGIVITVPALPGREAFAVWANDRPIVGIVPTSAGDRLRLGVAHEIGHLLMHVGPTSRRQAEQDAYKFAAELLMPEAPMRYEMGLRLDLERLARLKLPESAIAPMAEELSKLLNWGEQLGELDTANVEPMTTAIAMKLKMRQDVVTDGGYEEDVVRNAPNREDTFFTVPKVVE